MNEQKRTTRRVRALGVLGRTSGKAGLYLLHLDPPFKHARHYLGFVGRHSETDRRVAEHLAGRGSRLVKAAIAAGCTARLVWSMPVTLSRARNLERQLKNLGSGTRLCPECAPLERTRRAEARKRQRARKAAQTAANAVNDAVVTPIGADAERPGNSETVQA